MFSKTQRTGRSRRENLRTQPLVPFRVFGNSEVVTEGWYPLLKGRRLKRGKRPISVTLLRQRLVLFRGEDGVVRALDAFCPHFGADLGNGRVVGEHVECPLHKWRFDGTGRRASDGPPRDACDEALLNAYPVVERFGFVWVFSAKTATHAFPLPPGSLTDDDRVVGIFLGECDLYVHHHVLMANSIDLAHFRGVHDLEVSFSFARSTSAPGVADWTVSGEMPRKGWKAKLARALVGDEFRYGARFAGGAVTVLSYGVGLTLRGLGIRFPALHLYWGGLPQESGVSRVRIFAATAARPGPLGKLQSFGLLATAVALLLVLRREEIGAFPNFRFNPRDKGNGDESVHELIRTIEQLAPTDWSTSLPQAEKESPSDARAQADLGRVVPPVPDGRPAEAPRPLPRRPRPERHVPGP